MDQPIRHPRRRYALLTRIAVRGAGTALAGLFAVALGGCDDAPAAMAGPDLAVAPPPDLAVTAVPLDVIEVAGNRWGFVGSRSRQPFVPVGVNYDHNANGPCPLLIEEYWAERFDEVEADLGEIAALGFNVVRIHLQLPAFLRAPGVPDETNLGHLDRLVGAARRLGLRLDLTGLGEYRRDAVPAWFAALDDEAAMAAEADFWRAVASRYPDEPAIFCYDLQNEPFVASGDTEEVVSQPFSTCDPDGAGPLPERGLSFVHLHFRHAGARWTAWVQAKYGSEAALRAAWSDYPRPGESWAQIARPAILSGAARIRDDHDFRHALGALWTSRMIAAIRSGEATAATRHLVTVGLTGESLPFQDRAAVEAKEWLIYSSFSPLYLAPQLDFIAVHVYPRRTARGTDADLKELVLRGAHVGRPVVIEEIFPMIDAQPFDRFLTRSLDSASGWMSFYWGMTPAELRIRGDLSSTIVADWIDRYSDFARRQVPPSGPTRRPPTTTEIASTEALLSSPEARAALADRYSAAVARGELLDPVLTP